MDKLEHFIKKNHHRIIHYFTNTNDNLAYIMVLSVFEGVLYMIDLKDGYIPYVESGGFQKRFYVNECPTLPTPIHEQPTDYLVNNEKLLKNSLRVIQRKQTEGNMVIVGSNYMIDMNPSGSYIFLELTDFPDTLEQHGIFQKYDLDYFYNHKHTIHQTVKMIYDRFNSNFIENLESVKKGWDQFARNPSKHLAAFGVMLEQYDERSKQCEELKRLIMNLYQIWKQLSTEYDMMEVQAEPISFDQNLKMNQKKQLLYKRLDKIKLIEKHATDLLLKIHISRTCLLFYIHLLSCEMGEIQFRLENILEAQSNIQKHIVPNIMFP